MTKNMKRMAESINNGQKVGDRSNKLVHFLSFSVILKGILLNNSETMDWPVSDKPRKLVVVDR